MGASRRKLLVQVGVLGVVVGGACSLGYWRNHTPAPSPLPTVPTDEGFVGFDPMPIDLGEQPWYAEAPFGLEFFNGSDAPVTVERIESGCSCTVMDRKSYDGVIVEPGGVLPLEGTIEVPGREGPFRVTVDLVLASAEVYSATVYLRPFATYTLKPTVLEFGAVDLAHKDDTYDPVRKAVFASDTVSIRGDPITDSPWLEAILDNRGMDETDIVVRVLKEHLRYGQQTGRVTVPIDEPNHGALTIVVLAQGSLAVRPIPSHVFLRGDTAEFVRLVTSDGRRARAVEAHCAGEALAVSIDAEGRVVVANPTRAGVVGSVAVWATSDDGDVVKFLVSTVK